MRLRAVAKLKEAGENPYPHKFFVQLALEEFIERYSHIEDGDILEEEVTVAGTEQVFSSCNCMLLGLHYTYAGKNSDHVQPYGRRKHFGLRTVMQNVFLKIKMVLTVIQVK